MAADCLFCKIAAKTIPSETIYEDERYVAFRDINPQAPTHALIVPRKHIETVNKIEPEDEALVGGMFTLARRIAADAQVAEAGYRLVFNCNAAAGQTVWHLHMHLLGGRPMKWPPG
jgi:histidine triad (HIT) family protein